MTTIEDDDEDPRFPETGLPPDLQKALEDYREGVARGSSIIDCLWGELYGAINANEWAENITREHANRLRARYLFIEDGEHGPD